MNNPSPAVDIYYDITIWKYLYKTHLYDISRFTPENIIQNTQVLEHLRLAGDHINGRLYFESDNGAMYVIPDCCIVMMLPSADQKNHVNATEE